MVTDGCHLGSCPGLFLGGCHGTDERAVFAESRELVDQAIALYRADGNPFRRLRPDAASQSDPRNGT